MDLHCVISFLTYDFLYCKQYFVMCDTMVSRGICIDTVPRVILKNCRGR